MSPDDTAPRMPRNRWEAEVRELLGDLDAEVTDAFDVDAEGATARVDLAFYADTIQMLLRAEVTG